MKILSKHYLYSDMDGTLISDSKTISQENKKAIEHFISLGGSFSVATGRSEIITAPFIQDILITTPAILFNGAAIYDFQKKQFLYKTCLNNDVVKLIIEIALEVYPEVCIEAFTEGPIKLLNPAGVIDHYITDENQPYIYSSVNACQDCIKLLLYGKNTGLKNIGAALSNSCIEDFDYTFSAPFYLEILPKNVSKGKALKVIAQFLGICPEDFAAIGDFENDIEMIQLAGLGAAPANALEEVKRCSDVVVADNNHHALASLIDNYLIC